MPVPSYFRTNPQNPRWYQAAQPLSMKVYKRPRNIDMNTNVIEKKTRSNAANIAFNNGKINLVARDGRDTVRAILWQNTMERICRSTLNPNAEFLTRNMVPSAKMDLFIRTQNVVLAKEGKQLCVTRRTAYKSG